MWSLSASGDLDQADQAVQTAFLEDVKNVFVKYAKHVHSFFLSHPGVVITANDIKGQEPQASPAPESEGTVPPIPRDPTTGDALVPTPEPVDLANEPGTVFHAGPTPDSAPAPAPAPASTPEADSKVAELEARVTGLEGGVNEILSLLKKGSTS